MHYLFIDETYRDSVDGKAIIIGCWAVEQGLLSDRVRDLEELRQPGKAPIIERVYAAIESLCGLGLVGSAWLNRDSFRSGVIDTTKDIAEMKRPDTVWSISIAFAIEHLFKEFYLMGKQIGTVDVYFDPRTLKADHEAALKVALSGIVPQVARDSSARSTGKSLKKLRIRYINPIEKARSGDRWTKLQLGTWVSHKLCKKADWIVNNGGAARVRVQDMSEVVTRTLQRFEGKSFCD
jgi:hypothetical protein